jgi:hypothetical protein
MLVILPVDAINAFTGAPHHIHGMLEAPMELRMQDPPNRCLRSSVKFTSYPLQSGLDPWGKPS